MVVSEVRIEILEEEAKPYVEDDIRVDIWGIQTQFNRFESQIIERLKSVKAPDLSIITVELDTLKITVKDVFEL